MDPEDPVVALVDGGPDDADVVDVAFASCLSRERDLRLVHMYGSPEGGPTPFYDAIAREYVRGAMEVAGLVPGVEASAVCIHWDNLGALRRELANADLLVASVDRVEELIGGVRPTRDGDRRGRVIGVPGGPTDSDRLRFGYRQALLRELEHAGERADGATTPEALDDAWHVGIACPGFSVETIHAWAACSAWPPLTVPAFASSRR